MIKKSMKKKSSSGSQWIQKPIKTPDESFYQFFTHKSRINSDKILCRCHQKILTFEQMKMQSSSYALGLAALGVKKGDIVPICTEPSIEAIVFFFALNRLGAISCFLNSTAGVGEINGYLRRFKSSILVMSSNCCGRLTEEVKAQHIICVPSVLPQKENNCHKRERMLTLEEFLAHKRPTNFLPDRGQKTDAAHISFTSGTTGAPKSILLSNENLMAELIALKKATLMQFGPRRNSLQIVPFNYPYGFIVSVLFPMYAGKTAALTPAMTLQNIGDYVERYTPGYINGIPAFYLQLMREKQQEEDLSYIRFPVSGGDTLDASTEEKVNRFLREHGSKGRILNGCGNGEGCGSLLNPASVMDKYRPGSCGKPIPGLSVKLIDENGHLVPFGQTGRFCFSGTNLMMGYYNDVCATEDVIKTDAVGNRWFYSDTYMHMDKDGWMYMDGRERRFFITFDDNGSPYKVYSDHVQAVINGASAKVQGCVVVKKTDSIRSFVPIAYIQIKGTEEEWPVIRKEIQEKCRRKLQNCAVPVEYIRIRNIPLTAAGKVDYRTLEAQAVKGKVNEKENLV